MVMRFRIREARLPWERASSVKVNEALRPEIPEIQRAAVGVWGFDGRGISPLEAATLTDRLRAELVSTGAVTVVDRSQMVEVLEKQGFFQRGYRSADFAVEAGKFLGLSHMVTGAIAKTGSIGKIGQTYTIDVRMFSVETGAITTSANRTYVGEIDGLIMEIERIAWDMVELSPPPGRFPDME